MLVQTYPLSVKEKILCDLAALEGNRTGLSLRDEGET